VAAGFVAAIDHGTSSTRCILFDARGVPVATAQREQTMHYPQPGWVELDMGEVWQRTQECIHEALKSAGASREDVAAIGITNERETVVLWDRRTGRPVAPAITWQDLRTETAADALAADGGIDRFQQRTGLPVSTYSSALKLSWLLDQEPSRRDAARRGDLLFGTPDTWLLWNLTGGPNGGVHATDPTNAGRTLLMNVHTLEWDDELLETMKIPRALLPEIRSSSEVYGTAVGDLSGVPVAGVLGDQQASLFGHTCFDHGDMKNTYGTGAFLLFTLGKEPVMSDHGLITTVAWKLGDAEPVYALEGSVAMAGALIEWLRDNLGIIGDDREVEALARSVDGSEGVVFVPAFSGPVRTVLARRRARRDRGPHAVCEQGAHRAGGAGGDRVPNVRPGAGHARRHGSRSARRVASRRGHDQKRPADADAGGSSWVPRGSTRRRRDHRYRRRLRRRACDGILVGARRASRELNGDTPLAARHGPE
jgi:glycerol kinase